ncbi:MAG: c-type cytochrome, partial [Planctomycetota bacterium]
HPKVPAGRYRVTWQGRLLVSFDGDYTFSPVPNNLRGLRFALDGRPVRLGEPVALEFGKVPFELSGVHEGGPPELGLTWQSEFFAPEPVAPRFFGHLPAHKTPEVTRQAMEDSGAALAESFGCCRCHQGPKPWVDSLSADLEPELFLPGPLLTGTGRRLHRAWLADYLKDPAAHRPGTRMPAQRLDSDAGRPALETIVAYLSSGQTSKIATASASGSVKAGYQRYQAAGCAACHEPPEGTVAGPGVPLRIPSLDRLAEKWTVSGLARFVQAPLATRPHGRMPDFALSETDARNLAAYLLARDGAGDAPRFVGLPPPKQPIPDDARSLVGPQGQVLLMSLDEVAGTLTDHSGRNHHGHAVGELRYAQPGNHDGALGFDGEGGHVIVGDVDSFQTNADFTWSAWIKTEGSGSIFGRAPREGDWVQGGKTLFVRGGRLCFDVGWVGVATSKTPVNDGRWHHVAVTVKLNTDGEDDTVVLYIDGREDAAKTDWNVDRFPEENLVLKLGLASPNFPQNRTFDGLLDLDQLPLGTRLKTVALGQMAAYGCVSCHDVGAQTALDVERFPNGAPGLDVERHPPAARPLTGLGANGRRRGCLADDPQRFAAPRFDFSGAERSALEAYVVSLARRDAPSLAETASLDAKLFNCAACHDDEGRGSEPLVALLGGEEKAQFVMPHSLWGVAARLRPERLDQFLREGARNNRTRPWIEAEMPGFGPRGGRLARWLCVRDRVSEPPPPGEKPARERPAVPQSQIDMGRMLVSTRGLTCVNCHPVNGRQPAGEPDPTIRAPDLGRMAAHVRQDHFRRLLRDPSRIFPGTKMPVIFPKDGPAPLGAIRDLPEQVPLQALWSYLSMGRAAPPPLEEDLTERLPDVLRVYVQRGPTYVGKALFGRGIACGFPVGTLLYDADGLQPAALWFDGFLNRVPTNYFGLNWRAPDDHVLLDRQGHPLIYRRSDDQRWQSAPLPLECDPNTGSRFDGYTVGRSEINFRYRLPFGDARLSIDETLEVDVRGPWQGFSQEMTVEGLPGAARVAWTLPAADAYRFVTAAGTEINRPEGTDAAPAVVFRAGDRTHAVSTVAESTSAWRLDFVDGKPPRFVSPKAIDGQPLRLRIDRWIHQAPDREPAPDELAALWSPRKPKPPAARRAAESRAESSEASLSMSPDPAPVEEPFTYRLESIPGPPKGWRPAGAAFASDGTMYATGLTEGRVYRAKIPPVPVPDDFQWELYAAGLNVPTGMNVVDDRVLVSHRPEVTELVDGDGDGLVETFRTVTGPWSLKDGFHEYAFGLAVGPRKGL